MLGLLPVICRKFVTEFWPLISQIFVSPQYIENKLIEFHQILYMHLY